MRINLSRRTQKGLADKFVKEMVRDFTEEFDFQNQASAMQYISVGRQGLTAFVSFIASRGYQAQIYHLDPNRDLLIDVGENWQAISRNSPSFGFSIPENDPRLVEFKLRYG
jgi:hypothetical protein